MRAREEPESSDNRRHNTTPDGACDGRDYRQLRRFARRWPQATWAIEGAVHVAHSLREEFPDGQWYVRLRGQHEHAGDPTEVLAELLTYAGVRGSAVPAGQEARATAFRAALSGRRVLLVLDDAESAAQVEPLLPGGAPCAVLVDTRLTTAPAVGSCGPFPEPSSHRSRYSASADEEKSWCAINRRVRTLLAGRDNGC